MLYRLFGYSTLCSSAAVTLLPGAQRLLPFVLHSFMDFDMFRHFTVGHLLVIRIWTSYFRRSDNQTQRAANSKVRIVSLEKRPASILSALQPWVSLGLPNNQSPLLSLSFVFSIHSFIFITFKSATTSSIHLNEVFLFSCIFPGINIVLTFQIATVKFGF